MTLLVSVRIRVVALSIGGVDLGDFRMVGGARLQQARLLGVQRRELLLDLLDRRVLRDARQRVDVRAVAAVIPDSWR